MPSGSGCGYQNIIKVHPISIETDFLNALSYQQNNLGQLIQNTLDEMVVYCKGGG